MESDRGGPRTRWWLRLCLERPAESLRWISILTLLAGAGVTLLEVRTDGAAVHPTGNPIVMQTAADRESFRESDQAVVLVTARDGSPPLESPEGLRDLGRLHRSLEQLPAVAEGGVRSLASVLDPRSNGSVIEIERFLDHIPDGGAAYAAWAQRLVASALVRGLFLSEDGRTAALYASVAEDVSRDAFVSALGRWVADNADVRRELRLTGPVVAEVSLGGMVLSDLAWLVPIMLAVMGTLLFFSLGTVAGVLIPLAEVLMVLIWTLGSMGYAGVPITLVTTILPVVLMTMAVTDEIHLLERFQAHLASASTRGEDGTAPEARRRAMLSALSDVGRPIVLTSLTTSIGFLSFLTASMQPIRHFGLFAAIGISLAMVLSFSFVPALAMLLPGAWLEPRRRRRAGAAALPLHERLLIQHSSLAAAAALLLVLAAAPGLARLGVQDSWIGNFDPDSPLVTADRDFNESFWGSYRFDIVVNSAEPRFFQYSEGLRLLEELRLLSLRGPHVGGFASHLDPFGAVAEAIGASGPVSSLPRESILRVVPLAWHLRDEIGLDQLLAWGGRSARVRLHVKSADYARAIELGDYLHLHVGPLVAPAGVTYHLSGDLPAATAVVDAIVGNQMRSIAWAMVGIVALLFVLSLDLPLALATIAPLASAIVIVLGAMGYAGIGLGIATSMFTALALGVGVDFGIHFLHAYRRAQRAGCDHEAALVQTLRTSGRAIRWNATVLGLGFLVLTLSALKPNHGLGLLLCASMFGCYATTLLLLPRLMSRLRF
ncbi:MAG: RND family transporter [Myxococcota bacterium]